MNGLFHGKSIYKWMITECAPILENLHVMSALSYVLWHHFPLNPRLFFISFLERSFLSAYLSPILVLSIGPSYVLSWHPFLSASLCQLIAVSLHLFSLFTSVFLSAWWHIPLSKRDITPVINGISRLNPLIIGVITHLPSEMSHQVLFSKAFFSTRVSWSRSSFLVHSTLWLWRLQFAMV